MGKQKCSQFAEGIGVQEPSKTIVLDGSEACIRVQKVLGELLPGFF
jgi:hypothetical protein